MSYKTTGREVIASLLDETIIVGDGSAKILAGHLFCPIEKAETGSAIGAGTDYENLEAGYCAFAKEDVVLAEGDKVVDLGDVWASENLIGFARDKDLQMSKNSVDMTVDEDRTTDKVVENLSNITGSINGYMLNCCAEQSATFRLSQQFIDTVVQNEDGVTLHKMSTPTVVIARVYGKEALSGDPIEIEILPVTFTSDGAGVSYGSATTKNMNFEGNSKSKNGVYPQRINAVAP